MTFRLGTIALVLAAVCLTAAGGRLMAASPGDFASSVSVYGIEEALSRAKREKKHVFVYFWSPSCGYCLEFTMTALRDPDVLSILGDDFVVVSANIEEERDMARTFRVAAVPYLAFIDEAGQLAQIIPGFVAPDFFLVFLEYVRTKAYTETDFDRFVENLSRRAE